MSSIIASGNIEDWIMLAKNVRQKMLPDRETHGMEWGN